MYLKLVESCTLHSDQEHLQQYREAHQLKGCVVCVCACVCACVCVCVCACVCAFACMRVCTTPRPLQKGQRILLTDLEWCPTETPSVEGRCDKNWSNIIHTYFCPKCTIPRTRSFTHTLSKTCHHKVSVSAQCNSHLPSTHHIHCPRVLVLFLISGPLLWGLHRL